MVTRLSVAGWMINANPANEAAMDGAFGERKSRDALGYFVLNA
jgi:hypothetical protein